MTEFTRLIAKLEGKKKKVSIAQIAEILKLVNEKTDGVLYKMIRNGWVKND